MATAKSGQTVICPTSVRILGKRYSVERVDKSAIVDDLGVCDFKALKILVVRDLHKDLEQDTLLHEVMHAVDEAMQLKMSERQICAMASGLLAVLKDDKGFANYVTS
jgi:hypothetical protein